MPPSPRAVVLASYLRSVKQWQRIQKALAKMESRLKSTAHVVGYGVGPKYKKGVRGSELAAVFFVDKKVAKGKLKKKDRLPAAIKVGKQRVPTDIVKAGRMKPMQRFNGLAEPTENRHRHRPVLMGTSIEVCPLLQDTEALKADGTKVGSGTSGAIVQDHLGQKYILSAGHALWNPNLDVIQPSKDLGIPPGRNRIPPPPGQSPDPRDNIGGTTRVLRDEIDAGILESILSVPEILHIGNYGASLPPCPTLTCQKSGAKTGLTYGTIEYVGVTAFNDFLPGLGVPQPAQTTRPGLFFVRNNCGDRPFVDGGDSGALIVIGWANTSTQSDPNLGTFREKILADLVKFDKVHGRDSEKTIRKAMDRAALGLLIEALRIDIPKSAGQVTRYPFLGVGQEIDLALKALNVDLVTA